MLSGQRDQGPLAVPCIRFVPWAALASCRPLRQKFLPACPFLSLRDIFPRPGEVFAHRPRSKF